MRMQRSPRRKGIHREGKRVNRGDAEDAEKIIGEERSGAKHVLRLEWTPFPSPFFSIFLLCVFRVSAVNPLLSAVNPPPPAL